MNVRRQRRTLIGLALLFFAPLGLAFFLYYGVGWRPGSHVNHGQLIDPPRPLPAVRLPHVALDGSADTQTAPDFLTRKWTLLYWGAGTCAERCKTELYDTRQVRYALNRDMDRVQRVFIADPECCDAQFLHEQHPDLITIRASAADAPLLALLPGRDSATGETAAGSSGAHAPSVYLIDPLGNLMMSYPADAKAKGMLEDMKRLLRLSSIG